MGHLKTPEIQAIFSNLHLILMNFDNTFLNIYTSNWFWSTKFAYKNKILQKIVVYETQMPNFGWTNLPNLCPIFEFFEKLIP